MEPPTAPSKRPSLLPSYAPPSADEAHAEYFASYLERLAKRVLLLGSLLSAVSAASVFFGVRVIWPSQTSAQTAEHLTLLDSVTSRQDKRLTTVETIAKDNLYITCKVLARIQPAGAIPPQECK